MRRFSVEPVQPVRQSVDAEFAAGGVDDRGFRRTQRGEQFVGQSCAEAVG